MKHVKIRQGRHYPCSLIPSFLRYFGISRKNKENTLTHSVVFNEDCRYLIEGEDQWDWSKLFGFCFGITGIHKNSVRFGWRYNPKTEKIEISRITYYGDTTQHKMDYLTSVDTNAKHEYTITHEINGNEMKITMSVDDEEWETTIQAPPCRLRFGCWFYFGGNQKAPQDVSIDIE